MKDSDFLNFVSNKDLIFCSETWQKSGSKFDIDGYKCITQPRQESMQIRGRGKRGHRGICLFVRNSVSPGVEVRDKNPAGILWVKWAPSSEFVTSSIPSRQILTANVQPFRAARDLAFYLKAPLDSLLV